MVWVSFFVWLIFGSQILTWIILDFKRLLSSDDFFSYTTSFSNDFVNMNSNTPDTTFNQDEVLDALTSKMNEKNSTNKPSDQKNGENETDYDDEEDVDDDEDEDVDVYEDDDVENLNYNENAKEQNDDESDDYYHYSNETGKNSKKEELVKLRRNQPKQVNFK